MKPAEVLDLIDRLTRLWPSLRIAEDELEAVVHEWHRVLAPLGADLVAEAVDELVDEGREHAPPVSVIKARALTLRAARPDRAGPTEPVPGRHGPDATCGAADCPVCPDVEHIVAVWARRDGGDR